MDETSERLREGVAAALSMDWDGSESRFDELALALWRWHLEELPRYRAFCLARLGTLERVKSWRDIPALPVDAFKQVELACSSHRGAHEVHRFLTSGTTARSRGQGRPGVSIFSQAGLDLMDASIRANAGRMLFGDGRRCRVLVLTPPPERAPHMIMAYGMRVISRAFGTEGSGFVWGENGLDTEGLLRSIEEAAARAEPVCLIGASFGFVNWMDDWRRRGPGPLRLPPGSRVMDAGGYKGRSRELRPGEFRQLVSETFGVPEHAIVNLLGMTELASQIYDDSLQAVIEQRGTERKKVPPPWVRTRIVSPEDPAQELSRGEVGLLAHHDLSNFARPVAILTDDLGHAVEGGFQIIGRVEGGEARGCSLKVEELMTWNG